MVAALIARDAVCAPPPPCYAGHDAGGPDPRGFKFGLAALGIAGIQRGRAGGHGGSKLNHMSKPPPKLSEGRGRRAAAEAADRSAGVTRIPWPLTLDRHD
jgi:hypothetical protein